LLRHAESTHPHVFNGYESDVELSPLGRRQAQVVSPVLAEFSPVAVVSSAMRRAVQTAEPIAAACGLPVRIEPDLHERKVGEIAGWPHARARPVWQETLRSWMDGALDFASPGAESFSAMQRRLLPLWQRLADDHAGQTFVVVGHGHVCRVLLVSLLPGLSVRDWDRWGMIHNVALTELVADGPSWRAQRVNEPVPAVLALRHGD
jgi:broad specificity phosphatase PhoE